MLRRILLSCLFFATSTMSHAQGADWFYLQGDKDTVKLLWAPYEWLPEVQGFNVKRRAPGGTWKTLNSRPILPTYFPEDIDTRTNDPALREELRKFHQRVSTSEPPQALSAVLAEFAEGSNYHGYSKYGARRDAVLGAYRQALLFGFAYQDSNVPKGGTYEYALYPVMSGGVERDLPVATRIWKWGSVPSLKIPFGKPTLAPNTVESKMRISWPVEHAVLERNLVRHVRIYYVNAEGEKRLWTRNGVDEVKYLHAINVDLTGLGERGAVLFSAVPINYFDLEGTPSESISYEWDKYREAVIHRGPAVTSVPSPRPLPPPPPPPRTPATLLSSATLWLDASRGVETDGGRVTTWRDQSASHNDATMPDPARRPHFVTANAETPTLSFRGGQSLALSRLLVHEEMTVFIVGHRTGADDLYSPILGVEGGDKRNDISWIGSLGVAVLGPKFAEPDTRTPFGDTRRTHVLTMSADGEKVWLWRNGRHVHTGTARRSKSKRATGFAFNSVGSVYSGTFLNGELYAILVIPRVLGDAEIQAVLAEMAKRYPVAP